MIKGMTWIRGGKLSLLLGVALGLVAAALTVVYLQGAREETAGTSSISGDTVPVVVATQDIKAGMPITDGMIATRKVPADMAVANAFASTEGLIGAVPTVDLMAGEQLVSTRVLRATEKGQIIEARGLADTIPVSKDAAPCSVAGCGLRALSIHVSPDTAAAGLIRPGDRVDILASFKDGSAITVVSDVEVLSLGTAFERVATDEQGTARGVLGPGDDQPDATVATVALLPEEALRVAAAEDVATKNDNCEGTLRLSLRRTNQQGTFDIPPGRGGCAQMLASAWGLAVQ